ncbi:uncharacterized protein LOC131932078 [Physella acuta]|uniref:uncharacterized protein LOC131932078 n=1 Tax=Physella acuta TaxID=109671 RepID=UPI0027DC23CE|nr:uncharacterized protein LOC131932078 [Physella acuta]XP_059144946.1 uncharacterized protein LOC131932078 [Physella acuta]
MGPVHIVLIIHLAMLSYGYTTARTVDLVDYDDNSPVLCPPDNYFNTEQEACMVCSECPMNKIITSPCHRFQDTICGPFYELPDIEVSAENDSVSSELDNQQIQRNVQKSAGHSDETVDAESSQWHSLAVNLTLLISGFVIIIVAIIVGGVCFVKRRLMREKQLSCEYSPPPGRAAEQEC